MQFHRLASFIIGVWLGASVFMDIVATQNFQTVGRVIASMDLQAVETANKIGNKEAVRHLLRYFAGEANRFLFEQWEWAEMAVGLALLLTLLFCRTNQKLAMAMCLLMICLVAVQRFAITPQIVRLGREAEFNGTFSGNFAAYHAAYGYMELTKLATGLVLIGRLLIRERSNRKAFVREYERDERDVSK